MRLVVWIGLLAACGGPLSSREAAPLHERNASALNRGLAARGLTALAPIDADDGATALGDAAPAEFQHPTYGRTIVTIPREDHVFAVDAQNVVHDVTVVTKITRTVRENSDGCDPAQLGGGAFRRTEPTEAPRPPVRRYVTLAAGQTVGPPMQIVIEKVKIDTTYHRTASCQVP